MLNLWNELERSLAHDMRGWGSSRRPAPRFGSGWPRVDVVETDEALELQAEVPGFSAEEVSVTFHDGALVLEGKLASEEQEGEEAPRKVLVSERRSLSFRRTFKLSFDVNTKAISAVVKDGLLTVTLPKAEAAKPQTIEVKTR